MIAGIGRHGEDDRRHAESLDEESVLRARCPWVDGARASVLPLFEGTDQGAVDERATSDMQSTVVCFAAAVRRCMGTLPTFANARGPCEACPGIDSSPADLWDCGDPIGVPQPHEAPQRTLDRIPRGGSRQGTSQ